MRNMRNAEKSEDCPRERILYFTGKYFSMCASVPEDKNVCDV